MKRSDSKLRYNIVLNPEPGGGFTVFVPSLPGCVTYGETLSEARRMACDAIRAYVASLKKHGEKIPSDTERFISSVDLSRGDTKPRIYA